MHKQALSAIEARVTKPSTSYETIKVTPISPLIGAEISGIDLSQALSIHQFDEIHRAFLEHSVVIFRDQNLTADQHKDFGRRFGKLHVHALQVIRTEGQGEHERLEVKATQASKYVAGEAWHTDVSCDLEPPKISMLHIDTIPEIGLGGDTLFANMYLAYDLLSDPMKAFLEGLTAIHDGALPYTGAYGYKPDTPFERHEHPVVIRHPETGKKVLFVNRGFTSHIVQLTRQESADILEMLFRIVEITPAVTCRMRWTPNSMVMWDNRCTQHHALWDYFPLSRHGWRVSVVGERPSA